MSNTCPDCRVYPNNPHTEGCDVERRSECGHQWISCDCDSEPGVLFWDGEWPGSAACRRFGFYCYWGPGWIPCDRNHPEARENLNKLAFCNWNKLTREWEL